MIQLTAIDLAQLGRLVHNGVSWNELAVNAYCYCYNNNDAVVLLYIKESIKSDRSTLAGLLGKNQQKDMADIIRRL